MSLARLELQVAQLAARARLLERVLHDAGPWHAVIHGCGEHRIYLTRQVLAEEGRMVLTGYLGEFCFGAYQVDIYCGDVLATSREIPDCPSPFRITLVLGIEDAELTA